MVLNKADGVSPQNLMRVYGALMWSMGKVIQTPEVPYLLPRVRVGIWIGLGPIRVRVRVRVRVGIWIGIGPRRRRGSDPVSSYNLDLTLTPNGRCFESTLVPSGTNHSTKRESRIKISSRRRPGQPSPNHHLTIT